MSANFDVIVVFPIYIANLEQSETKFQMRSLWIFIFIYSDLLSYKTENITKKSVTQVSQYCFE